MNIYLSGSVAYLRGYWTLTAVTQSAMDSLAASLQKIIPGVAKKLLIDCRDVIVIDCTGLELLYVWLQCVRLRDVEPELLNPPNKLRRAFQRFGFRCRYSLQNKVVRKHTTSNHRKQRSLHKNQRDIGNYSYCHA